MKELQGLIHFGIKLNCKIKDKIYKGRIKNC